MEWGSWNYQHLKRILHTQYIERGREGHGDRVAYLFTGTKTRSDGEKEKEIEK